MRRFLLSVLTVALLLAGPAVAADLRYEIPDKGTAQPVFLLNHDTYMVYVYVLIAIGGVIALLLVLNWVQLSGIKAALDKQSEAPKS